MIKFTCLVTLGLFVTVQSASLFVKPVDIPVEVIYDDDNFSRHQTILLKNIAGRRNLNEKIQLPPTNLKQLSTLDEHEYHGNLNSVKNLDAKIQLSLEELRQADKHLPLGDNKESALDFKSNSVEENSNVNVAEIANQNINAEVVKPEETEMLSENVNPTESGIQNETVFGISGETTPVKGTSMTTVPTTTEENLPDPNIVLLIQIAQNIVASGLDNIRENIDNLATNEDGTKNPPITAEQWNRLNQTIQDFFATLLDRGTTIPSNENVLREIVIGIQGVTTNFVENLQTQALESLKTANPQVPGGTQNIINVVTSGFQKITENIGNIPAQGNTTKNTVLENATATTAASRPLQGIIDQVQQIFGGQSTSKPSHVLSVQEDSPSTSEGPLQVFQNVANQVGQAINNLNPFTPSSTAAPGSQGDEGSTPENPLQSIQNAANQVGQAINNLNPFNRPSSAAPGSQGDAPTTVNPFQSFQNAANQVGQAINNLNPFNQPSTAAPGSQGDAPTTTNPFQSFQNAANQVGQAINNLNPFRPGSTAAPGSQNEEISNENSPFQVVQSVVSQVGQAVNNFINQGVTTGTGSQNEESSTPLPIQQAFQNVANQLGSAINNLNPFNPPSTPASSLQSEGPLQGVQNVIGQVVSTLNPLNQISTASPGSNPLQGVQNAINQAGQFASSLNPLNQDSSTPSSPISGSLQTIQAIGSQGQQLLGGQPSVNSIDSLHTVVNKPADPVSGTVETIPSIGNQIITPEKKPVPQKIADQSLSEQEIMVAVD